MSAARAKLPADHIHFGYAAFMNEDAFQKVVPAGSIPAYAELRSMV
jgi:hypothetical protein